MGVGDVEVTILVFSFYKVIGRKIRFLVLSEAVGGRRFRF